MNESDLTNARMQALLEGQLLAGRPAKKSDVVVDLRPKRPSTPSLISSGALAEFLDIVELTIIPDEPPEPTSRKRVSAIGGGFVATAAGKLVLGTALAAAAVGGAHAAAIVDVPLLPDVHDVVELQVDDPDDSVATDTVDGSTDADSTDNHGTAVSGFVESTELEGCEKGQAVSAVASANAEENRNNPVRDHDPCAANDKAAGGPTEPAVEASGSTKTNNGNGDPGTPATPGASGNAPGQSGDSPGQAGNAPGQSGDTPGKAGNAPGQSGETPGKSGEAPGQSKPDKPDES